MNVGSSGAHGQEVRVVRISDTRNHAKDQVVPRFDRPCGDCERDRVRFNGVGFRFARVT